MQQLVNEIKNLIITSLNLEDISANDIDASEPLFGEGLGLDSIDALELGLAIKKKYGITLSAESEEAKQVFSSINSLATFISSNRTK